MPFNAERFLSDYNIPTDPDNSNGGPEWVQVMCPFPDCDDANYHGGFNLRSGAYHCWRCGKHPLLQAVRLLARCSIPQARIIIEKYRSPITSPATAREWDIQRPGTIEMPPGSGPLNERARRYLESRRFDPDYLERKYHLQSTGNTGQYKFRIMAPIYYRGQWISYQGRDITGKAPQRYKVCGRELEIIHYKHVLYEIDRAKSGGAAVVVEGITDQWRLGDGAVATFGIMYTQEQLILLCESFSCLFIFYDAEPQAQEQAHKLALECGSLGTRAEVIHPDCDDPASMTDEEAQQLMKELLG